MEVKKLVADILYLLYPAVLTVLLFALKQLYVYLVAQTHNKILKEFYNWTNKEIVSILTRLKDDEKLRELVRNSMDGVGDDKQDKKILMDYVKKEVLLLMPSHLKEFVGKLFDDLEDVIQKQIEVFFSSISQMSQEEK